MGEDDARRALDDSHVDRERPPTSATGYRLAERIDDAGNVVSLQRRATQRSRWPRAAAFSSSWRRFRSSGSSSQPSRSSLSSSSRSSASPRGRTYRSLRRCLRSRGRSRRPARRSSGAGRARPPSPAPAAVDVSPLPGSIVAARRVAVTFLSMPLVTSRSRRLSPQPSGHRRAASAAGLVPQTAAGFTPSQDFAAGKKVTVTLDLLEAARRGQPDRRRTVLDDVQGRREVPLGQHRPTRGRHLRSGDYDRILRGRSGTARPAPAPRFEERAGRSPATTSRPTRPPLFSPFEHYAYSADIPGRTTSCPRLRREPHDEGILKRARASAACRSEHARVSPSHDRVPVRELRSEVQVDGIVGPWRPRRPGLLPARPAGRNRRSERRIAQGRDNRDPPWPRSRLRGSDRLARLLSPRGVRQGQDHRTEVVLECASFDVAGIAQVTAGSARIRREPWPAERSPPPGPPGEERLERAAQHLAAAERRFVVAATPRSAAAAGRSADLGSATDHFHLHEVRLLLFMTRAALVEIRRRSS